ncbi:GNAT family N-acetyltransferase [Pseudomonas sp. v388]|uniref:GNAT family N-acetyltransferase n=1 Tax=Pseudomonas sp. v388 TaxID=2479849 RepID=UPI000F7B52DE|nr:GNAT family N-acetyltransferase [Pseudomonas sp. v388]RRV05634.1 GNAT family N-acetyltransferase [Pseudomonas sp. v388]
MQTRLVGYHELDDTQRRELEQLEVQLEQQAYCGDIHSALNTLLVRPNPNIQGFVLLADEHPVGFLMLKRDDCLPHWAQAGTATLHALQIDYRLQGQGLGKACLQELPAAVRRTWPEIEQVMLSVDADNLPAMSLYTRLGWDDTGEAYRGRIGFERRMTLRV